MASISSYGRRLMDSFRVTPTSRPAQLVLGGLCLVIATAIGCDRDEETEPVQQDEDENLVIAHPDLPSYVDIEDPVDLTRPDDLVDLSELEASEPTLYTSCREIFEDDGDILDWPIDDDEVAATIFGCNPDGYLEFDDGRRAIAYEIPIEDHDRATDLRVALYNTDGTPHWDRRMDRSHRLDSFAANYRGSFMTAVDNRLLCIGTRWHETTQTLCARFDTGVVVYDDHMNFWAGVLPFGYDGALYSADIQGITKRYPFTGVEMRHRSFDERGGRAGFYATDEERVFVVPSRGEPILTAWDLESLRKIWSAELYDVPRSSYSRTSADHRLLLFIADEVLIGIDSETGELRMAFNIGSDTPPVVFGDDEMFVLLRRLSDTPLLYALDPEDGEIHWAAEAPEGSLDLEYDDGILMTRTVRTVRTVRPAD